MIYIYTDGACSNNQEKDNYGGWGSVLIYGKHQKELSGSEKDTTNNRMEMQAVIEAFKALKTYDISIKIFSDSSYIVDCINKKWYVSWEKNSWKNASKKPVLNKELWKEILFYYRKCKNVEFLKIKGHVNPENSDELRKNFEKQNSKTLVFNNIDEYKKHIIYNNLADELAVNAANTLK